MEKTVSGVKIELVRGDIASQPGIQAVVNAANAGLRRGGGVAGAIHRAAGPGLEEECIPLAPIKPGEAVITGGHNLPNDYVIHCLGPVYGRDKPEALLLASCYKKAVKLAEEKSLTSVAFPAISAGIFGYPLREAAEVALGAIIGELPSVRHLERIRFVLFGENDFEVFCNVLTSLDL